MKYEKPSFKIEANHFPSGREIFAWLIEDFEDHYGRWKFAKAIHDKKGEEIHMRSLWQIEELLINFFDAQLPEEWELEKFGEKTEA